MPSGSWKPAADVFCQITAGLPHDNFEHGHITWDHALGAFRAYYN